MRLRIEDWLLFPSFDFHSCIPNVRTQQHPCFDDLKRSIINRQWLGGLE